MAEKHVHKFRRHTYKTGNVVYFCALPDCSIKISPPLALGKRCICWRCEQSFIMNDYSIRLAKPHCPNCHKSKSEPEVNVNEPSIITSITQEIPINSLDDLRSRLSMATHRTEDEDI